MIERLRMEGFNEIVGKKEAWKIKCVCVWGGVDLLIENTEKDIQVSRKSD